MNMTRPLLILCAVVVCSLWPHTTRSASGKEKRDGSTMERAFVIQASSEKQGVEAEYAYLKKNFPGYRRGGQALQEKNGRMYDRPEFTTATGEKKTIFFDITAFFGKLG